MTKRRRGGILTKLSARRGAAGGKRADAEKNLKKVLDKRQEVRYNSNVPPGAACTL